MTIALFTDKDIWSSPAARFYKIIFPITYFAYKLIFLGNSIILKYLCLINQKPFPNVLILFCILSLATTLSRPVEIYLSGEDDRETPFMYPISVQHQLFNVLKAER